MASIIVPKRSLILPRGARDGLALPQSQRGFMLVNPSRFGSSTPSYRFRLQFPGADGATPATDDTGKSLSWFGNAQNDTALGDQRGLFDGFGDYFTTPNHTDLVAGAGDFACKVTVRHNSKAGFQTIMSKGYVGGPAGNGWLVQTGNGDALWNIYLTSTSGATFLLGEPAMTVNANQDYDMEWGRVGGTLYIKRDAVTRASTGNSINWNNTTELSVGGGASTGYNNFWFNGWLKDLRFL